MGIHLILVIAQGGKPNPGIATRLLLPAHRPRGLARWPSTRSADSLYFRGITCPRPGHNSLRNPFSGRRALSADDAAARTNSPSSPRFVPPSRPRAGGGQYRPVAHRPRDVATISRDRNRVRPLPPRSILPRIFKHNSLSSFSRGQEFRE
jgi:hypothetical protein